MSQYAESRLKFHPWICDLIYQLRLEEMSWNDSDWIRELKKEKLIPDRGREEERSEHKEDAEHDEQAHEPKRKPS